MKGKLKVGNVGVVTAILKIKKRLECNLSSIE